MFANGRFQRFGRFEIECRLLNPKLTLAQNAASFTVWRVSSARPARDTSRSRQIAECCEGPDAVFRQALNIDNIAPAAHDSLSQSRGATSTIRIFEELKRRNVLRVAAAYIVTSWLVVQVVETLFPVYGLSDEAIRLVVNILAISLIPVLVLSWVFEWTPAGIKRKAEVDHGASVSLAAARRLDRIILIVLVLALALALALGYFAFGKFVLHPKREAEQEIEHRAAVEQARREGVSEALQGEDVSRQLQELESSDASRIPLAEIAAVSGDIEAAFRWLGQAASADTTRVSFG